VANLPIVVEARPRTLPTSKATTTLKRGVCLLSRLSFEIWSVSTTEFG